MQENQTSAAVAPPVTEPSFSLPYSLSRLRNGATTVELVSAPPCPPWCEAEHSAGRGWGEIRRHEGYAVDVSKHCTAVRGVVTLEDGTTTVTVELDRFASCDSPVIETDDTVITIGGWAFATPAQARELGALLVAAADAAQGSVPDTTNATKRATG